MASKLFNPQSEEVFQLSRSRVENFLECPKCFYLTNKLGISRPKTFPFNLNNAVDELLKNEFDIYRAKGEPHPLIIENKIDAIPYSHPDIDEWRDALRRGVKRLHEPTNLLLSGGIDDVWINTKTDQLIIVDYKATSKKGEVNLDADWQIGYKRQAEFYQWLLRGNSFDVSNTAYFVYCNGIQDKETFDNKLDFKVKVIPYVGNDSWIEPTLFSIKSTLIDESPPKKTTGCEFCSYINKNMTV